MGPKTVSENQSNRQRGRTGADLAIAGMDS
jgi:hypothetical protein